MPQRLTGWVEFEFFEVPRARLEKRLNTIGPVMVGQKVVRIQPDEKTGRDLLEDLYGKVIKPEISRLPCKVRGMLRKVNRLKLLYR